MPTNHDAVAAIPTTATAASKTLTRNVFVKRMPYALTDAEDSRDLIAVDPNTGAVIEDLLFLGRVFHYDSSDHTTVHDGTTCLVSNEGNRYKLASGSDIVAYSILDITLTAPPGSPSVGDRYLVATGGTGSWSGHDGEIAAFTARGWEFETIAVGRLIYDESTDSYYHKKADGTLTLGFGTQTLQANTHPVSALIGKPVRWIVENQTTNTPPGSPSVGDAYIVGASPTGAWAGHAGKIAICEVGTTFTIYTPRDGERAYDKTLKFDVLFNSTSSAWISSAGAIVGNPTSQFTTTGSTTTGGSGSYTYSDTTAPTTSQAYTEDSVTLTYTAKKTGARLRFAYQYAGANSNAYAVALFRDAETNSLAWYQTVGNGASRMVGPFIFEITASDTSSHTYKIRLITIGAAGGTPTRRLFSIEEFA
jgi:hypothetical protein